MLEARTVGVIVEGNLQQARTLHTALTRDSRGTITCQLNSMGFNVAAKH